MRSVDHSHSFCLPVPVSQLFPLFSPEGEKSWVPGWDYHNIMGTTALSEDYVFLTRSHDHAGSDAVWIVKQYDPSSYRVQFYRVEPGEKVGLVKVHCHPVPDNSTRVEVTYRYVALSASGQRFVEGFDQNTYRGFIEEWRVLLARHFDLS